MLVKKSIFKAYDIRGIVQTELGDKTVQAIGKAIGTKSILAGESYIVVGRDGRISSPHLQSQLIIGLKKSGCHIMDIGMVATPMLYFATKTTAATSGVMITGSHNPPQYNGFKIVIAGQTLASDDIQNLYQIIRTNNYQTGAGSSSEIDIKNNYLDEIVKDIKITKPLKVVLDCGNGVTGCIAPELYQKLGVEVVPLFCTVDGHFPNHYPDPSDEKNLKDLQNAVQLNGADVGLAFDGDGDRLGLIDNESHIIWADRQMILYAKNVLSRNAGGTILFDIKCSRLLATMIKKYGGNGVMVRTGHSFIKAKIAQTNALLAGEMSGHIFFKDRWYGFDDALYTGARLLEILANSHKTCTQIFAQLPNSINTPEININFDQQGEQFGVMEQLIGCLDANTFNNACGTNSHKKVRITDIDGIRADFETGWGLVRPSNTMPCLVLRFEADTHENLEIIKGQFRAWFKTAGIENVHFD